MMKIHSYGEKKCCVCSSSNIELAYTCPLMPLGGQLVDIKDEFAPELFYPLHYVICRDCSAFQSMEAIPENLLRTEVTCVSSTFQTLIKRDYEIFLEIMELYDFGSENFTIDIGGSDGAFLQNFLNKNIRVLNIEPVKEMAGASRKRGIETVSEFLTYDIASMVVAEKGKADLVVAKQVLELVSDLHEFLKSVILMLSKKGRIMMEVPYVKDLVEGNFYDILTHLRQYHFSLTSLKKLFSIYGLVIENVIHYSSLGGGLRFYAAWKEEAKVSTSVNELLKKEQECRLNNPQYYINNLKRGIKLRRNLLEIIDAIKEKGKKIVGYGAGIKSSALLNFCGLDNRYIEYLVDNARHKQGKLMPGVRLPIFSPKKIDKTIDYVLLLAWLYQDEIIRALKPFIANGGKIIIPTPDVRVI